MKRRTQLWYPVRLSTLHRWVLMTPTDTNKHDSSCVRKHTLTLEKRSLSASSPFWVRPEEVVLYPARGRCYSAICIPNGKKKGKKTNRFCCVKRPHVSLISHRSFLIAWRASMSSSKWQSGCCHLGNCSFDQRWNRRTHALFDHI